MFRDTEYHTAKRLHVSINITQLKFREENSQTVGYLIYHLFAALFL